MNTEYIRSTTIVEGVVRFDPQWCERKSTIIYANVLSKLLGLDMRVHIERFQSLRGVREGGKTNMAMIAADTELRILFRRILGLFRYPVEGAAMSALHAHWAKVVPFWRFLVRPSCST
jgi:hypothetical protein